MVTRSSDNPYLVDLEQLHHILGAGITTQEALLLAIAERLAEIVDAIDAISTESLGLDAPM